MAFRSWNRGLAATYPRALSDNNEFPAAEKNPYAVWIYNGNLPTGQQWYPDPTFPGRKVCPGHTILWAGKLDYWLIGGPTDNGWSRLCRYDGAEHEWQPFAVPKATLERVTVPTIPGISAAPDAGATPFASKIANESPRPGGITSGACLYWNDCWFFGTYGVVLHWNGQVLTDDTPPPSERWLSGEYLDAATSENPLGIPFAMASSSTAESLSAVDERELVPTHRGAPPPELFRSDGFEFSLGAIGLSSALPFEPPTHAQASDQTSGWDDPFRTDLVAVGLDPAGQGWVAGNPADLRDRVLGGCPPECESAERKFEKVDGHEAPQPAPLIPISPSGERATCTEGPFAPEELSYTPDTAATAMQGAFLWSSIGVIPSTGEALAGGFVRPQSSAGVGPNEQVADEPVIAQAACDGQLSVTRFRTTETVPGGTPEVVPADRNGSVSSIVANADNDAWAATSEGTLSTGEPVHPIVEEQPHLYQLTDGLTPNAPEGNEEEIRPVELEENPPIFVFEGEPEPPPEPPLPPVTSSQTIKLAPAIYKVQAKLHHHGNAFSLYLSFKVRRPITLGAQALQHGRVVSSARPRRFNGHSGVLVLPLNRKHWPTKVRFVA